MIGVPVPGEGYVWRIEDMAPKDVTALSPGPSPRLWLFDYGSDGHQDRTTLIPLSDVFEHEES